jgi:glutaredoxin
MYYEIYGISDCPACLKAQALLMQKNVEYVFVNADFSKSYRDAIREEFFWATFPIVVLVEEQKRQVIGGYDQLKENLKR